MGSSPGTETEPTWGKTSWEVASKLWAVVLTWLTGPETEAGSAVLGSMATRPGRTTLLLGALARGSVDELGAGGARMADRDEKALRMIGFILG